MKTLTAIKNRVKEDSETKYLILIVAAGHGMNANGQQVLLLNEFKRENNFYKWLAIESYIRTIAKCFPNTHTLAFFACCREIYLESKHMGYKKGTLPTLPVEEDPEDKEEEQAEQAIKTEEVAARGSANVSDAVLRQNFACFFGCKPSDGVLADTKMVMDAVKVMLDFDKKTWSVMFPDCFDDLKGSDANFEMVASNTM